MSLRKLMLICAALGVLLAGCGDVPGNSVAVMAGNPITKQAFNHWMYVAAKGQAAQTPGAPVVVANDPPEFKGCIKQIRAQVPQLAKTGDKQLKTTCSQLYTSLGSQVMDFLIKAYWYQAEAARLHVKVTDQQVQQTFNQAKNQQFPTPAAFQNFLTQSGQTLQDILFRFRIDQILRELIQKHNQSITPATIQAYYNAHRSQFGSPETRDIRIVRTKDQAQAQKAKSALQGGQNWDQVAKQYSIDPTKNKGGQLKGISRGQEEKALSDAAFSSKVNQVIGPIHGTFGWYVFEVTKVNPATQKTLAQATPLIRQILQGQSQSNAQSAVDNAAKSNWLKKTSCRSEFKITPSCNGYKAPKTLPTGIPGGGAAPSGAGQAAPSGAGGAPPAGAGGASGAGGAPPAGAGGASGAGGAAPSGAGGASGP